MYRGFKITKEAIETILENKDHYITEYKQEAKFMKKSIKKNLEKYLKTNEKIDVESLKNEWFPIDKYDVFLSHSHIDIEDIEALAGYLVKEKKLKVFVDSFVWGYFEELQKDLDNKYNLQNNKTYNYKGSNWCCNNVSIILNSALQEVINKSEAIFFYNTPNSITHDYNNQDRTESPWIFSEIETTRIIRKNLPERIKLIYEKEKVNSLFSYENKKAKFSYLSNNNHLDNIDKKKFDKWIEYNEISSLENISSASTKTIRRKEIENQLDKLYSIVQGEQPNEKQQ